MYEQAGQLPRAAADSGNVTYTISNDDPARSDALILQLPVSEELRKRAPFVYDEDERRAAAGELVYTIISANKTQPGSNRKLFDIGELLSFDDDDSVAIPTLSSLPQIELQHNTNILDLTDIGLSADEINTLTISSSNKKKELEKIISSLQSDINDVKVFIIENQKKINELRKIIESASIAQPNSGILIKLSARNNELIGERNTLISNLNKLNEDLTESSNALIKVSSLVK